VALVVASVGSRDTQVRRSQAMLHRSSLIQYLLSSQELVGTALILENPI
jgi:hypothetical protein